MLNISSSIVAPPLRFPWKRGIAVGRAYDLMRADLLAHLAILQRDIGFETCRFHGVFHDDMGIVRRQPDGRLIFRWARLDQAYDALLHLGLKPFVELNPMPAALASGSQKMFHYKMNVTPPRDWTEWELLVEAFASHCIDRYGEAEVRSWHFEVWNEPNLSCFWSGTKQEYFELYRRSALALKRVDPHLRVGGPASSKACWLTELIEYCDAHEVPLDFLSSHLYPQDEFVEYADAAASPHVTGAYFVDTIRRAGELVTQSSRPDLPLHWTEWNTQLATCADDVTWADNRYVDSLHAASFIVQQMVELDDAAESFIYWVASDIFEEGPIPHAPFSHTYGLLTIHGLPKASANAFKLLNRMRGHRLEVLADPLRPDHSGGFATRHGRVLQLLFWNNTPPLSSEPPVWEERIRIAVPDGSSEEEWLITSATIKAGAGSCFEAWEQMGSPLNPSASQLERLRAASLPEGDAFVCKTQEGHLAWDLRLLPNEVVHFEIRRADPSASRTARCKTLPNKAVLEAQLGEKSRP